MVVGTSICTSQEEPGRIQEVKAHGTVPCAELKKICLLFKPKELQYKSEIKAVLDHQLVNVLKLTS